MDAFKVRTQAEIERDHRAAVARVPEREAKAALSPTVLQRVLQGTLLPEESDVVMPVRRAS